MFIPSYTFIRNSRVSTLIYTIKLFLELVKAAQQLKEKDSPIKIAKVNGPEEEELLKKMEVKGYPTLFFYR